MSNKHQRYRQRKEEKEERLLRMEKFFSENFPQSFLLFEESERNRAKEAKRQDQVPNEAAYILGYEYLRISCSILEYHTVSYDIIWYLRQ
jgi:hypothetical protein